MKHVAILALMLFSTLNSFASEKPKFMSCESIFNEIETEAQRRTAIALIQNLPKSYDEYEAQKNQPDYAQKIYDQIYEQVTEERKLDLNRYCQ